MSTAGVDTTNSSNETFYSFGNNTIQRQHRKTSEKLAKQKARLVFLLKCRRHNIVPRFILDQVNRLFKKYSNAPQSARNQVDTARINLMQTMLNVEITMCHRDLDYLKNKLESLSQSTTEETLSLSKDSYEIELKRSNKMVYEKFVKLQQTQEHTKNIRFDESFIKNLTSHTIPEEMKLVLSLGQKFSITPEEDPIIDLASDIELAIKREVPLNAQRAARGDALYSLAKFSKQNKRLNRIDKFLQKAIRKTREFLQQNPGVMISNSDKGNVTIISNKEDYHRKITELLSDLDSFTPLEVDPTKKVTNLVNRCLDNLYKANIMQAKLKTSLKSFNAIQPRLFAQIKYHKPGNPIRLIVSTINSAAYKLSRFLATILRKSFKPKYSVKNSQQFVKLMKNIKITEGNILVSFDVVNCFGNIPTKLALELIERDFKLIEEHTPIPKEKFMQLLDVCLNHANHFVYNGKHYRQNKGMFMGSSLAPILVERVIEEFVDRALTDLKLSPDFWSTYVDDHLTSVPRDKVEILKNQLNSYNEDVQFTVELEDEHTKSINFLDLTVYNQAPTLKTNWYHKAIASNRILNFHSKHPKQMVRNVAKGFLRRVFSVSHRSFHNANLKVAKGILEKNSFPTDVIDKLVNEVQRQYKYSSSRVHDKKDSYPFLDATKIVRKSGPAASSTMIAPNDVSLKEMTYTPKPKYPKSALGFAGVTYIDGLSDVLKSQLKRHAPDLKVSFRPTNKVSQVFSNMKDKLEIGQNSNVVYSIRCKICGKSYIGETSRRLCERCSQHAKDVENKAKKPTKTALVAHVVNTKHEFDFSNAKILKKVRTRGLLKIHEANHIILNEGHTVNFKKDAKHVSPVFYNLIKHKMRDKKVKPSAPNQTASEDTALSERTTESGEHMFSVI
ncbi:uncharacterized protein LOC119082641 [Bradysia coprophila]|uniref:uncharacterized protein LOC119082641 n=1 Tax=Bradysia coprophila TaxID=38358 RepID=UPI00187DD3EF|nr:uncharacterized protein LOC119082641 [Bradysia coprophila]